MKNLILFPMICLIALGGLLVTAVDQRVELDERQREIATLQSQLQTALTQVQMLEATLNTTREELQTAQKQITQLDGQLAQARRELQYTQKMLAQKEADLAAREQQGQWQAWLADMVNQVLARGHFLAVPSFGVAGMMLWVGTHKTRRLPTGALPLPTDMVTVTMSRQQAREYAQWRRNPAQKQPVSHARQ